MLPDFERLPPFVQVLWAEAARERIEYLAMVEAHRRRRDWIARAIAAVITFFAVPYIAAYFVLWGRKGKGK